MRGLASRYPPATEEIGAVGREIETRRGIPRVVALKMFLRTPFKWQSFISIDSEMERRESG
jgi:hypothetical protein